MSLEQDIAHQLSSMTPSQLQAEVARLTAKLEKQANRAPQSKEKRTEAYLKMRGEPGTETRAKWDASRKAQADKRAAKHAALIAVIKQSVANGTLVLSPDQAKLLKI